MSNLPPPQFPPPQPNGPDGRPPAGHSDITQLVDQMSGQAAPTSWYARPFLKLPVWAWLVAAVALVGVGAVVVMNGGDDEPSTLVPDSTQVATDPTDDAGVETTVAGSEPTITEAADTSVVTEPVETVPAGAGVVDGAPEGERGTQSSPVAPGTVADIGGGWRLQVLAYVGDAAAAIAAESEFNDPPPDGQTFSLVTVAVGYYGLDDPAAAYTPTINALGADKVQLETSCGLIPQELPVFTDVFTGGVVTGNLCFVTTPADANGITLYANADFFGGDDTFLTAAPPAGGAATPMPTLEGPQPGAAATEPRTAPNGMGTPVDVGAGWTLTVTGAAHDITDAVVAGDSFSDPPPDGYRFIGVDITYTFNGEGSDVALSATTKAVDQSNVELSSNCGTVPGQVDLYSDVFAGGSVSGTICFVAPATGGDLVLYSTTFADDFVHEYFATK